MSKDTANAGVALLAMSSIRPRDQMFASPFPADMAATVYHLLGIYSDTRIYDYSQRPYSLVIGSPIEEILA